MVVVQNSQGFEMEASFFLLDYMSLVKGMVVSRVMPSYLQVFVDVDGVLRKVLETMESLVKEANVGFRGVNTGTPTRHL